MIWRSRNPTLMSIPQKEEMPISNGKIIKIGVKMSKMRTRLSSLTEEQKEFWKDYGL